MLLILFSLSAAFELLHFFLLADRTTFGFSLSLSRIFQVCVLLGILFSRIPWKLNAPKSIITPIIINYFGLIFSVLIGVTTVIFHETLHLSSPSLSGQLPLSLYLRPFIELILFTFYLYYYLIIGSLILHDQRSLSKFIAIISGCFTLSLALGYFDLIGGIFDFNFIARHIAYYPNIIDIGFRFNGLWGEPRDAIPGLLLGMVLVVLQTLLRGENLRAKHLFILLAYSLAIFFTYSISGYFGIIVGFLIFLAISNTGYVWFIGALFILTLTMLLHLVFDFSEFVPWRISYYYSVYGNLDFLDFSFEQLTFDETTQMFNIYPLAYYFQEVFKGNILASIFGYGAGYSGIINRSFGLDGVAFPSSEGVRLLVERGILGLCLFLWLSISFAKLVTKFNKNNSNIILIFACLIIGSILGHRSHAFWILFLLILQFYQLYCLGSRRKV